MPGGDAAVREPWRMALAWLLSCGIPLREELPTIKATDEGTIRIIQKQIQAAINAPETSSMGRLFDAAASLIGVCQRANYEAQAAIELEALVDPDVMEAYEFTIQDHLINPRPGIEALVSDYLGGTRVGKMAAKFHNGVALMVSEVCMGLKKRHGISDVVLSGGVWQNIYLLKKTLGLLRAKDFTVFLHEKVPANDGGLSLGQVVVAAWHLQSK